MNDIPTPTEVKAASIERVLNTYTASCQCHEYSHVRESRKRWCEQLQAVSQHRQRVCGRCEHVWDTWEIDEKHLEKLIPTE